MKVHYINQNNSYSKFNLETSYGNYYFYEDVCKHYPQYIPFCEKREILNRLPNVYNNYILAIYKHNTYTIYKDYSNAKMFFKKDYVDNYIDIKSKTEIIPPIIQDIKTPSFLKKSDMKLRIRGFEDKKILYFSIKSISNIFEAKDLVHNITKSTSTYLENTDYVVYNINLKKCYYFTIEGFTKYITNAKNMKAKEVKRHLNEMIQTLWFGTTDQKTNYIIDKVVTTKNKKQALITKLGIEVSHFRKVVKTMGTFSCVYLLVLKHEKNNYIVKYGKTKNLYKRLYNHNKNYNNVIVNLCRYIDETENTNAENELKDYFVTKHKKIENYNNKNCNEIYNIEKKDFKDIETLYDNIAVKYGASVKSLNENLKATENNIEKNALKIELDYKLQIADLKNKNNNYIIEIQNLKKQFELEKQLLQKTK